MEKFSIYDIYEDNGEAVLRGRKPIAIMLISGMEEKESNELAMKLLTKSVGDIAIGVKRFEL